MAAYSTLSGFPLSFLGSGNNGGGPGVHRYMDLNRLRDLVAAPMACLFVILILCLFAVQRPVSSGILVPMMRTRTEPLRFCEFNGFTVYLRSDGKIGGWARNEEVSREASLSRIREARENVEDDTLFVIADPDVSYGDFASLIAYIHRAAPLDRVAVVTSAGQVQGISTPRGSADRPICGSMPIRVACCPRPAENPC